MKTMMRFRSVIAVCLGLALGAVVNTTAAHGGGYGPGYGGYGGGYGGYGGYGYGYGYGPHAGSGYGHQMGPGYGPGLTGPRYGPGPHYYAPGMMGPGYGRPRGAGPMGPGYGPHAPGMMGPQGQGMYGPDARPVPERNLSATDVRARLEHWLQMHGLSGLRVGDVSEQDDDTITAELTDRDGKVVQRYEFDRHTGAMRPAS